MNVVIFDTETVSLNHPFCYNIGYAIVNLEERKILCSRDFVCEQVWHNIPLFSTAYYADKRPIYISAMKGKTCKMNKIGFITQKMIKDFDAFNVEKAFAYNAPFDEGVFNFNCEYFKIANPFDNIPIIDIVPYVHKTIAFNKDYQDFCEQYKLFTESGNYSTTAESVYKFITNNPDFNEEHTALSDSLIEKDILFYCLDKGIDIEKDYKKYSCIPRKVKKMFTIKKDGRIFVEIEGEKIRISKDKTNISIT